MADLTIEPHPSKASLLLVQRPGGSGGDGASGSSPDGAQSLGELPTGFVGRALKPLLACGATALRPMTLRLCAHGVQARCDARVLLAPGFFAPPASAAAAAPAAGGGGGRPLHEAPPLAGAVNALLGALEEAAAARAAAARGDVGWDLSGDDEAAEWDAGLAEWQAAGHSSHGRRQRQDHPDHLGSDGGSDDDEAEFGGGGPRRGAQQRGAAAAWAPPNDGEGVRDGALSSGGAGGSMHVLLCPRLRCPAARAPLTARPRARHRRAEVFELARPADWGASAPDPPGLKCRLFNYQRRALAWLTWREAGAPLAAPGAPPPPRQWAPGEAAPMAPGVLGTDLLNPLWRRVRLPPAVVAGAGAGALVLWRNAAFGLASLERPRPLPPLRGGVLAEEMGLGKTVGGGGARCGAGGGGRGGSARACPPQKGLGPRVAAPPPRGGRSAARPRAPPLPPSTPALQVEVIALALARPPPKPDAAGTKTSSGSGGGGGSAARPWPAAGRRGGGMLVVAPPALVQQWRQEVERHSGLAVAVYDGLRCGGGRGGGRSSEAPVRRAGAPGASPLPAPARACRVRRVARFSARCCRAPSPTDPCPAARRQVAPLAAGGGGAQGLQAPVQGGPRRERRGGAGGVLRGGAARRARVRRRGGGGRRGGGPRGRRRRADHLPGGGGSRGRGRGAGAGRARLRLAPAQADPWRARTSR